MKKIFFYGNIKVYDKSSGIAKKVFSQIKSLRSMGYKVYYSGYIENGVDIYNNEKEIIKEKRYNEKLQLDNRKLRRWRLLKFVQEFINETSFQFNYSYLRFHFFDHAYLKLLKTLKKKNTKNI